MGPTENPHGIFQSHGQMLIANSEESLAAHDVDGGWDWTRIPGATTMTLTLEETLLRKARYFSARSSAGGVTFKGTEPLASGAFGMDFHQPDYQFLDRNHPHPNIKLHFKKSVFFFQNVIICLGSNIRIENGPGKKAQTTLFQDKLQRGSTLFSVEVDGVEKNSSSPIPAMTPALNSRKGYITLVDTKGNCYYFPPSSASSLKFQIENQTSKTSSAKPSSGYYATTWLEHSPSKDNYEYAVEVKTSSYPKSSEIIWRQQWHTKHIYKVLKQDDEAHVVKFQLSTERWAMVTPQYGYVIFTSTRALPAEGPIRAANKKCRIMATEDPMFVYLSISYPDLAFSTSKVLRTIDDIGVREAYQMESSDIEVLVALKTKVRKTLPTNPIVHGAPADYVPNIRVESTNPSRRKGRKIVFANLKNGFSVEIKLRK